MVQQQVKFARSFRLPVLCPVKQGNTEFDKGCIEAEQLVLKPKRFLSSCKNPTLGQQLIKDLLIQLSWPMLVGIGQGGAFGRCIDAQVFELSQACRQSTAYLPQRVCLSQLTEQHRNELAQQLNPFTPFSALVSLTALIKS